MKRYFAFFMVLLSLSFVLALSPTGPDTVTTPVETTKIIPGSQMVNTTGGSIATFNLSATIQNPRWKAFIGNVTGSFTLENDNGEAIYDWELATITGRVYASRHSGTINWNTVRCADSSELQQESLSMDHDNPDSINDNVTATFDVQNHPGFYVGATEITANSCFSLNTNVNDAAQASLFEEVLLIDGSSHAIYTTILEEDQAGYNGDLYDFQMIVPERGTPGWTGSTAYYLYVELGN